MATLYSGDELKKLLDKTMTKYFNHFHLIHQDSGPILITLIQNRENESDTEKLNDSKVLKEEILFMFPFSAS